MNFRKSALAVMVLLVALLSFIPLITHAGPLDSWRPKNPLPQLGNHLYGIATNGSLCIVVGEGGRIITSTDGYNWVTRVSGITDAIYGVTYGNGTWIAVANKGTILKSSNGTTWTKVNEGYSDADDLRGVAFGKGMNADAALFVAVGKNGKIITSPTGDIWTYQVSPTNSFMNAVTFGNGVFVAVGSPSTPLPPSALPVIMTSKDGINWGQHCENYCSLTESFKGITYGNNFFVAVGSRPAPNNGRNILVSADGYDWDEDRASGETNAINGIAYGNKSFVAVSAIGSVLTSLDNSEWSKWSAGIHGFGGNILYGVAFFKNIFIAVGSDGKLLTSPDGKSWTERSSAVSNFLYGVAYGEGTYAAVGWGGKILTSNDMVMWVEQKAGTSNSLFGIAFGNKKFVAVSSDGKTVSSSNGIKWTVKASGFKQALFGIAYGNDTFVAVGSRGKILTSADGLTWKSRTSRTTDFLYGITYANNIFVAVGQNGRVLTSPDGTTWTDNTPASTVNTNCLYGVTYNGSVFIAVGDNGTILTSPDHITWTKRTSGCLNGLRAAYYANNMLVVLGNGGKILTSSSLDGVTWTAKTSGIVYSLFGMAYDGKDTLVTVGAYATILSSKYKTDSQWTTWTIRSSGTYKCLKSIAYGDNTFVAVGETGTILTSKNGTTWDLKTLPSVTYLDGVAYGDGRFVAVGNLSNIAAVYTSTDNGVTWYKTFPPAGYTPFNPSNLYGATYGGGQFLVGGIDGIFLLSDIDSPDAWWCEYLEGCYDTKSVAYGEGTSVMVGACNRTFLITESPMEWWMIRFAPYIPQENKLGFTGIAYGTGTFAVVGPKVKIVISEDSGRHWRQVPLVDYTGTFDFTGITYGGNNIFTAVGTYGKILTSPDGIHWTFRRSGTTKDLFGMIYGASSSGNTYICVGKDGTILQSDMIP